MDKKSITPYARKLLDPRWQRKRLEILNRDNFTCLDCGDKESTLHVHHCSYIYGRDPWDYDEGNFRTLCEGCHETRHGAEAWGRDNWNFIMSRMTGAEISRLSCEILDCFAVGETPRAIGENRLTSDQLEWIKPEEI